MGRQASADLEQRQTFISRSEAKSRGLPRFYDGKLCRLKHSSERYTANGACIKCVSLRDHGHGDMVKKPRPPEPPLIKQRQELPVAASPAGPFVWTLENTAKLIDAYVDTGDIGFARDAVGVRPSEYRRELERNEVFAAAIAEAEPKAQKHLEERAIQLALRGNDKLLVAVLKARLPEYRDSIKIEQTHVVRLSDEELDRRIRRFTGGAIIDARFTEVESQKQIGIAEASGGESAPSGAEQDLDPLLS
jgi:hypothetical protein